MFTMNAKRIRPEFNRLCFVGLTLLMSVATVVSQPAQAQSPSAAVNGMASSVTPASTLTAASCSRSDVQTAINQAQNGDTVLVPAGACTWSSSVNLSNAKGVSLLCAAAGSCSITSTGTAVLFDTLSGINNRFYRISGFTFINTNGNFIIWIAGDGTLGQVRVDHNTFNTGADSVAVFFGHTQAIANYYGVIDHNVMTSTGNATFLQIIGDTNTNPPPSQTGTANNMFVEDNTIAIQTMTNAGRGCMDSWGNGAIVWRRNDSLNCLVTSHGVTHSGGPQNLELYDNTLRVNGGADPSFRDGYRLFHHQGSGEFVAFNNRFTAFSGKSGDPLEMTHYRSASPQQAGYDESLGRCDGTSPIDGNRAPLSTYFGYPCWRQPGRDFAGNLKPMYVWNNRWSDTGGKIDMLVANPWGQSNPTVQDHIKPERDYYNAVSASAQTSPSTPFNGTSGMGFGTLANRPATCMTNALEAGGGVGYFATDQGPQGTLYRCSATNTWTAHYQPYPYPHPLTFGTAVADLRVSNALSAGGVLTATLNWTPPATAITTTLRYSSALITDANWASATLLTATRPGSANNYTATVPYSGGTVYFALKTQDATGTYSPLSNNAFWPRWDIYLPLVRR